MSHMFFNVMRTAMSVCIIFTWGRDGSWMHYGKKPSQRRQGDTLDNALLRNIDTWMLPKHAADHLHSFMAAILPDGLAQQDKAPCSPAEIVQEWFEGHDKEFKVLTWSPDSPRSQSNRASDGCARKTWRLHLVIYRI